MKRCLCFLITFSTVLFLATSSFAQLEEEKSYQRISVKPGLGFEYFSRTIEWNEQESKLKSYFFTLNAEFKLQSGLSAATFLGYSSSNFNSLIFRNLPFSLELEGGRIGGYILGGEIKKSLFYIQDFEIGGVAQFAYYFGKKEKWEISGLNVEGTAEGKPSWMRAQVGPLFLYKGYDYFYPYLYLSFNKLWGTFKMDQTIQDLKGNENKKISGKSLFNASLGAIYEISTAFSLKGEASIMPYKDGVDLGLMIKATYSF